MTADFAAVFAVLKPVLAKYAKRLSVKADTPIEFNFKTDQDPELVADLKWLTAAGFNRWREKNWL